MKKDTKGSTSITKKHYHSSNNNNNDILDNILNLQIEEMNPKKVQEILELHQSIQNEIKEYEAKIKYEKEQRMNLIQMKRKEIEKKENSINQVKIINQRLNNELEAIQEEVESRLDKMEYKEKHDQYEYEKQQREDPLKQLLKVNEKEINEAMQLIGNFKKEKDKYELELKEKIDLVQVNFLNDNIKMVKEKVKDLEREVVFLQKIKNSHQRCIIAKENLELEINVIKRNIQLLKLNNKEQLKQQQLANSFELHKSASSMRRKLQERIESEMKHHLEDFKPKNDNTIALNDNNSNGSNKDMIKSPYNENKRRMRTNSNKSKSNLLMNNMLPSIGLFNSNEKKVLSNILPIQEIEKYEKRYESLDITKANMERKLVLENELLNKENKELEDKYAISNMKLKENELKKTALINQINDQKQEFNRLKVKHNGLMKQLENYKKKAQEKDDKNRELAQELILIQKCYNENNLQE